MKASEASKKNANGFLCISVHLLIAAASAGQVCNEAVADGHTENTSGFLNHNSTDAEIAVGPDHILSCTNSWLRLHNKSGQPIAGEYVSLADFPTAQFPFFVRNNTLTSTTELIGDPVVLYDYHADRYWILADELVVGNLGLPEYSHYQFAINVSPPSIAGTSDIWMYFDEATWEYPGTGLFHLAHNQMLFADAEALYNVARWDSFDGTTGGREAETIIHIWDKASLLQGNKPTATRLLLSNEGDDTWGHCPAIEYSRWDNTHPMYLVATKEDPEHTAPPQYHHQTTIRIGAVYKNTQGQHVYDWIDLPEGSVDDWFDLPEFHAVQGGTLRTISSRFLHATYVPDPEGGNTGRIWCVFHILPTDGGTPPQPVGDASIRWYEIEANGWPLSGSNPFVVREGQLSDPTGEFIYVDPAIAVDSSGNVGLAWTRAGENLNPEFWMG